MFKYAVLAIFVLSFFAKPGNGQSNSTLVNAAQAQRMAAEREAANNPGAEELHQRLEREAAVRIFAERQAQLRRDTEKLVELAAELKDHVAKSGPNILSMDVIKKAAEIRKLAKSVEEKMKNAY